MRIVEVEGVKHRVAIEKRMLREKGRVLVGKGYTYVLLIQKELPEEGRWYVDGVYECQQGDDPEAVGNALLDERVRTFVGENRQ